MSDSPGFIFTCEHAHADVPKNLQARLNIPKAVLQSHQGSDPGALQIAGYLADELKGQSFAFPWTRLAIDANRSLEHPGVLSPWSRTLDEVLKRQLIRDYQSYRSKVESAINKKMKSPHQNLCIVSVHSFTPKFRGKTRKTELGILFRPWIDKEKKLATHLKKAFQQTDLAVHFNLPYRGFTDCFLNDILDAHLKDHRINGCFLEINQRLLKQQARLSTLRKTLASGFKSLQYPG